MIKKLTLGFAIFFVALAVFVIANFPARFAVSFLPPGLPVALNGVSGTIWQGRAAELRVDNRSLGELTWQLQVLPLLLGKASADFEIHRDGLDVVGHGAANYARVLTLRDTQIDAQVERVPLPTERLMAEPSGTVSGFITAATIKDNWIDEIDAHFDWNPAGLLSPVAMELGEIALDLNGNDGNLNGTVNSQGALQTQGGFQISAEGRLTADIRMTPTEETPAELRDILPMFGQPARDGSIRLKQTLQLPAIR